MNTVVARQNSRSALTALMRSDALLPAEIVPGEESLIPRSAALVTGATGFLGRFVVRQLLERSAGELHCLVRAGSTIEARERLANSLRQAGVDIAAYADRVFAIAGATDRLRFGLDDSEYRRLADQVATIYHCAAEVNWARGYRQLRPSNVSGTLEVIRFACTGHRKRVLYASTIAVCFATEAPDLVDESTDMLDYVERMPLAYAQTKCVSESLLRAASSRGLPVSVIRPSLISGHSETGAANPADLISALIESCVASGAAIDTDWQLDCVPVDYVAKVLAGLGTTARPHWELLNLYNEHGRAWREVVLWMNLYGYPIALMRHPEWLERTFDRLNARYSLFGYRRFFGANTSRNNGPAPYESFLRNRQGRVRNVLTLATLADLGLSAPALDATLLERYLQHYARTGMLPATKRARSGKGARRSGDEVLRGAISGWLDTNRFDLGRIGEKNIASHNGIFNEVASARVGNGIGIRRLELSIIHRQSGRPQTLDILLKTKPSDSVMQDLLVEVATLCSPQLGILFENFKWDLGLAGSHERELAVYEDASPALRSYLPRIYGTGRNGRDDSGGGVWAIAMEYLGEAECYDVANAKWNARDIGDVIHGLAGIHAANFGRDPELERSRWFSAPPVTARMLAMSALWQSLSEYSAPWFDQWLDQSVLPLQKRLIDTLGDWWPEMRSLPRTLVHNDCNPRNFALRRNGVHATPLFFDWELSAIDVPQRDLAELLCFVLPPNSGPAELVAYLELHRQELEIASGAAIDKLRWHRGFMLSLRHLIINRLPLYTLMHRFRPQPFLPTVVRNWQKLYLLGSALELKMRPRGIRAMARSDATRVA
ncbi:MAG: thioester reductase domain-containing protein [Gammaproteobacteria bacterium]|nr:thioester reductase domain-containing protein [Gammaproteobacteria bacterium]MDH4313418.1 thioester reductase domain-containing protein [Gammaproteobacteria bacterium]MDH5214061.1 thioester reductase domain-containing protein [Gammaproteobacteria bacterium]